MNNIYTGIILISFIVILVIYLNISRNKKEQVKEKLNKKFSELWRLILNRKVLFYTQLNDADKQLFEKRIQFFLATKTLKGIETDIDDTILLMVASSAIIPTFAFPDYNYPNVHTVLIYPNSFDEQFKTKRFHGHREFITGLVGNRSLNGTIIISKPDLILGFSGLPNESNVGIHEFVHLLDQEDGDINGIPEVLMQQPFVAPWLNEIKKEKGLIAKGMSDINPYALTNNAEFLAVVSEYFFDNPTKLQKKHPELYSFLSTIFNTKSILLFYWIFHI